MVDEWRLTPQDQRFAHIMIGGAYPVRAFYSSLGTHEQREKALREWMVNEGIDELTREDDHLTGDIVLRAHRQESRDDR